MLPETVGTDHARPAYIKGTNISLSHTKKPHIMNFSDIPLASHDLQWASENFINTYGKSSVLESGEVINTEKGLLYIYGAEVLRRELRNIYPSDVLKTRIDNTQFLIHAKEELCFVRMPPAEMKEKLIDATFYIAVFPSSLFLYVGKELGKSYLRCHDSATYYPVVAYGPTS
uniref:Ku protein n=4 Tax=Rhizobium/Agrobacterium group TaxID=227290 RepID=A0A2Z2Q3L3_9HYPH|nr:Ku protein [Agrobacterium larrymoorei]